MIFVVEDVFEAMATRQIGEWIELNQFCGGIEIIFLYNLLILAVNFY